jgi:hypothetical protein
MKRKLNLDAGLKKWLGNSQQDPEGKNLAL